MLRQAVSSKTRFLKGISQFSLFFFRQIPVHCFDVCTLHWLSLKRQGKMSVSGVSVAVCTAFWVQEVVWILLIYDHLLYALVDGIQSKGLSSYDRPVLGWTICLCPSRRGLWWVACIRESDWGGTVPFSLCHFLLSICWQLPLLFSIGCPFLRL